MNATGQTQKQSLRRASCVSAEIKQLELLDSCVQVYQA